ncbi:MAG TPA: decaprenyl-phosphate phosphoribosyltransferase [Terriglobales bacterium]|nr:decaprenyl-phosphate phosphoribosyltransferase [Terriglobales bacterium]
MESNSTSSPSVAATARGSSPADLIRLMRPAEWIKNSLVFGPLIFSKHLFDLHALALVTLAFFCFCVIASGAYVMNDLQDCERDRQHPLKRLRPLPAGRISRPTAVALAAVLMIGGIGAAAVLGTGFLTLTALYLGLQFAYTYWLKEIVILDVMAIAAGFVIRAAAGGVVIDVPISPWLIICTFLLMLFLGFSKRRHELTLLEENATHHRASLREYSPYFLDQMISVVTASTVVAYAIYTVSPEVREKLGTELLYLTIPFVLFGIFRYLYLVHQREQGGNPSRVLLSDRPLLADILLWFLTVAVLLY